MIVEYLLSCKRERLIRMINLMFFQENLIGLPIWAECQIIIISLQLYTRVVYVLESKSVLLVSLKNGWIYSFCRTRKLVNNILS